MKTILKKTISTQTVLIVLSLQLLLFTLAVVLINYLMEKNPIKPVSKASSVEKQVKLSLFPQNIASLSGSIVTMLPIMDSAVKPISFAKIVLTFNPAHMELLSVNEKPNNDNLDAIFPVDVAKANKTGTIQLMYGANDSQNAPTKTIELSILKFKINSESESSVSIDKGKSQVTFMTQEKAEIEDQSSVINSHPQPTKKHEKDIFKPEEPPTGVPEVVKPTELPTPESQPVPTLVTSPEVPQLPVEPVIPTGQTIPQGQNTVNPMM